MSDHLARPIAGASLSAILEKWLGAAHVDAA
jgi:hypothetical protein